jgi:hypothetical protein
MIQILQVLAVAAVSMGHWMLVCRWVLQFCDPTGYDAAAA